MTKKSSKNESGSGGATAGKFLLFLLITLAVGSLVLKQDGVMDEKVEASLEAGISQNRIPPELCGKFCFAHQKQLQDHHGGTNFMDPADLLEAAKKGRDAMMDRLKSKEMYGEEYYKSIFTTDGEQRRKFFVSPTLPNENENENEDEERVSEKRFQRKLSLKLLRIQMELMEQNSNLEGCDCNDTNNMDTDNTSARRRRLGDDTNDEMQQQIVLPPVKELYDSVVWASGGHSAAAGHGNLLHENYPEYMERLAKDVFHSVGLDLIGRNNAMGGMDTVPEVAMCLEAKMGLDADIISWDSGMTEGGHPYKLPLYANRIGGSSHRNRPIFAGIQMCGNEQVRKIQSLKELQEWGLTTLYFPCTTQTAMHDSYPDMSALSGEQAEQVAPYAAYFRCKDMIEDGEPRCKDMKYNTTICPNRFGMASWHPGWKWHANVGHAMALFMVDSLVEALEDLTFAKANKVTGETYDPRKLFEILKGQDDKDYQTFKESALELPTNLYELMPQEPFANKNNEEGYVVDPALKPWILARAPSICHSAFLPSQSRYLGLFDGRLNRGAKTMEETKMEEGITFQALKELLQGENAPPVAHNEDQARPMKLVQDGNLHVNGKNEDGSDCGHPVLYDFKDWMSSTNKDGWTFVKFPNQAELEYYKQPRQDYKPRGFIMMCFLRCDWGKCPAGEINLETFDKLDVRLNGIRVVDKQLVGSDCAFLRHERGLSFDADENGQYELKLRVGLWDNEQPDVLSFVRITTLVVV